MLTTFVIFRVNDAGEEEVLREVTQPRAMRPDVPPGWSFREKEPPAAEPPGELRLGNAHDDAEHHDAPDDDGAGE